MNLIVDFTGYWKGNIDGINMTLVFYNKGTGELIQSDKEEDNVKAKFNWNQIDSKVYTNSETVNRIISRITMEFDGSKSINSETNTLYKI